MIKLGSWNDMCFNNNFEVMKCPYLRKRNQYIVKFIHAIIERRYLIPQLRDLCSVFYPCHI